MKIREFLDIKLVLPNLQASNKTDVLSEFVQHIVTVRSDLSLNDAFVFDALMQRERLGSTGIGDGVAVPHAKIPTITELVACCGRSVKGISFDAFDEAPVHFVFVLLVPEHSEGIHLKALARISRLLKSAKFRQLLMNAASEQDIYRAFIEEDGQN